jgi:hypothetical protein
MEQQPGRRQGGRPPAGDGRGAGNRSSRPADDYVEDDPTMVRPFVKAGSGGSGSGGRRGRQGADGGGPGGASGGQGRQQGGGRPPENGGRGQQNPRTPQNGRSPQNGRAPQNGRTQNGRNRQNAPNVPGQRPPREADRQQVPGLVSTPMPPPRAVARHNRPDLAPYPELDPPLSDLTTTMPILAVPDHDPNGPGAHAGPPEDPDEYDGYDGYDGYENAPPGENGHYQDDADFGRHRGGNRPPRALKAAGLVIGVVVAGVAAYSVLGGGGSGSPSAGPPPTGNSSADGAPSDSATSAAAPNAPAPTGTPTDSGTSSASQTTASASHSSKSPSKSSSSSHSSASSSSPASHASTPPPTTPPPTSTPPPSVPSPTFTSLGPGSSGAAVTQLQQNLKKWGGYYGWPPLRVNGTYDTATTDAVQAFQDANAGTSPPDPYGTYGPATDKALVGG